MLWKLCALGDCETTSFAVAELKKYLELMDLQAEIALLRADSFNVELKNVLWVGQDVSFEEKLPACANSQIDDGLYIDVQGTRGIITGVNPRSVLLAVYRFLTELGCAWVRPGRDGEIIPRKPLGFDTVSVCETPSYRHRAMCIEGAVSYEHVYNMIDWLPKVGMNGYFNQFMVPFTFFDRWYSHQNNPELEPQPMSVDEISALVNAHIRAIKKRGLLYHAAGHGWTCDPFGIEGNSWDAKDYQIPPESANFLALINGKRQFCEGLPLNTNLCYSNEIVREKMTSAIAEYCRQNRDVDYLHFWLGDGMNNHCECDNCKDTIPADYYVEMLNDLDGKLTDMGLDTKVVFLIYVDLLWEPQTMRLRNPDRFVLMFAPITRTYTNAYVDADLSEVITLSPYKRNRLEMPRGVGENVARLRKWQEQFEGDSFIFDYHFMWDHFRDPGYSQIAQVMFDDMKNLDKLRLNGMLSCQVQRASFPTGLGISMMAKTLWNKNADFDAEADHYYAKAFGRDAQDVRQYLSKLSELFDPAYLRHEKPQQNPAAAQRFAGIPKHIEDFREIIETNLSGIHDDDNVKKSWIYLRLHAQLALIIAKAVRRKAEGDMAAANTLWQDMAAWARMHEKDVADVFDVFEFILVTKNMVAGDQITLF